MSATPIPSPLPSSSACCNADPPAPAGIEVVVGLGPLRRAWAITAALGSLACTALPAPERLALAVLAFRLCDGLGRTEPAHGQRVRLHSADDQRWYFGRPLEAAVPWSLRRAAFLPGGGAWLQFSSGSRRRQVWVPPQGLHRRLRRRLARVMARAATAGRSPAASIGRIGDLHHETRR